VENVYGHRTEEGTEDELILLLFPCKKSSGKTRTVGSCNGRKIICGERHTVEPLTKEETP